MTVTALNRTQSTRRSAPLSSKSKEPTHGLLVTLDAKPGKQDQVATLLSHALNAAARETGTITWYAYRITETKFGIFDTFFNEDARHAHLNGDIAKTLVQVSDDLLSEPPRIQSISIVTSKI